MNIRPLIEADKEQIQNLVRPLVSVSFNWSPENLDNELVQAKTWVLEEGGKIRAFICLRDLLQAYDLTMVATEMGSQRKGYMMKLMSFVMDMFGSERQLWLEVHQNNQVAQEFYKKIGFQHSGTRGGYYSDGSAALLYTYRNPLLY